MTPLILHLGRNEVVGDPRLLCGKQFPLSGDEEWSSGLCFEDPTMRSDRAVRCKSCDKRYPMWLLVSTDL